MREMIIFLRPILKNMRVEQYMLQGDDEVIAISPEKTKTIKFRFFLHDWR